MGEPPKDDQARADEAARRKAIEERRKRLMKVETYGRREKPLKPEKPS
ncbi:MAG TPA: hypothetical protein VF549_13950 [Solirubrobacteraceae bacterium]|jgi:hypothetical protein